MELKFFMERLEGNGDNAGINGLVNHLTVLLGKVTRWFMHSQETQMIHSIDALAF